MSVQAVLQAALVEALAGLEVTAVFDAPPVRAARPYALVEEAWLSDWGTKDMAGREGRFAVTLFDAGERPARLRGLAGAVEAKIEAMPRAIGEGWEVASLVLLRSRISREGDGRWQSVSEFRVRMLRSAL
ncbi:DUF3168 domain-containing protein [Sphingomonas sp. R-74633]|uniref:DUF3168 domain-containing protein n=1 Tax=Sphingomonas sp. R-74633 TaxID=2751188 RepID=UPI0015D3F97D|nr:DUF3168 domain-containing protein [Sphingomonas sp. R-74633]NYT42465.1 DUF3168 domain-containing protein [Sphingomonas sp. R-74633]